MILKIYENKILNTIFELEINSIKYYSYYLKEDIIKEVESLVKDGYKEVTLLGQNVNAYGKDFKNYYVHYVLENSPASKAGFQRGDIIHKIGIWPARFFSMEDISRKLSKKDKTINITIKRNTLSIKKKMQLHDLFEGPDK